jgi:PleD family two-component response regulator
MAEGRILVVEDEEDIAELLRIHFTKEGYAVEVATRGAEALELTRKQLPDLIVLDIMLPGMDGYAVCRELRSTTRTGHIPIIFLTQKDERSDRIAGLELGADDYVTKPFDDEELKLRVKNAIQSHRRMNLSDPRTGLPSARLIEEQLRTLMRSEGWTFIEVSIDDMQPFNEAYGFVATDEVLRFTALLFSEVVDELGTVDDFIGHAGEQTFVIVTYSDSVPQLIQETRQRFMTGISTHYNFLHSEQGGISRQDGSLAPLMSLSFGTVRDTDQSFADIREITEAAAQKRRLDRNGATF